jgi:hypothetical protein
VFQRGTSNIVEHSMHKGSEAHSTSCLLDTRALFIVIKRSEREAGHLPPSSSDPKYIFIAMCLTKQRGNFTLLVACMSAFSEIQLRCLVSSGPH